MKRFHFEFRETIATVMAENDALYHAAKDGMMRARHEVERCIAADPFFLSTFSPYRPSEGGRTIQRMVSAGESAGVGPMASVAGAIAWAGLEAMMEAGATGGTIDNGGDIALLPDRGMSIGIYAGNSPLSGKFAFFMPPSHEIVAVCTSSATVGHSISLGIADAVTVFGSNPAAADAWATAICNALTPEDLGIFDRLEGSAAAAGDVNGVFAIFGDLAIRWGSIPRMKPARVDPDLITRGM
ncbi:MAG: UPF0280 family protein [Methanomicrobiales archaeon]|nr:UPF0280 family protein [Methanomicrobiales archaeon]